MNIIPDRGYTLLLAAEGKGSCSYDPSLKMKHPYFGGKSRALPFLGAVLYIPGTYHIPGTRYDIYVYVGDGSRPTCMHPEIVARVSHAGISVSFVVTRYPYLLVQLQYY